jgi:hypothetical protein
MSMSLHVQILSREFEKRRAKNARYSLRAYAAYLGLHPSALSRVLAAKQLLSLRSGLSIVKKLSLEPEEARRFLQSVIDDRHLRDSERLEAAISELGITPVDGVTVETLTSFQTRQPSGADNSGAGT